MIFRIIAALLLAAAVAEGAPHTVVIEAENFGPLKGSNFSFQEPTKTTKGSWSLSGPGVAAEWTQGGESEFMSIAARADEPAGTTVSHEIEVPAAGNYTLWVRYADYRNKKDLFGIRVAQGDEKLEHVFGEKAVVDELDPMKLIWDWSFAWDSTPVKLAKGKAKLEIYTTGVSEARRQIDLIVVTTDERYKPAGREKPDAQIWAVMREMKRGDAVEPVVRQSRTYDAPKEWNISPRPTAFVWNVGEQWMDELKKPDGLPVAFGVDPPLLKDFLAAYRGKEIPVFGQVLSGPSWGISNYPAMFADGSPFLAWLEKNPQKRFSLMLNYSDPSWKPFDPQNVDKAIQSKKLEEQKRAVYANLKKYHDRFVGYIAGESVAHASYDTDILYKRVGAAKTRGDILAAWKEVYTLSVVKKFSDYYGQPVSEDEAWAPLISCLSANNEAFCHAIMNWGARQIGHENTGNSPTLARRLAFLRGAARQFNGRFVDYQSANLGDAATMFSRQNFIYPANSKYILDNSYDAFAGAGVTWLLKDYLLWHMAGVDAFYNEQGIDMFWKPGGIAAGDNFPVQLSPKGKVAETVLNLAEKHPRGVQYTPVAFLLDEAHGWSQERFSPGSFGMDPQNNPAVLTPGAHEAGIRGWMDVAYYPAAETQNEHASGIRQTYVAGIFGDIFDVIVTAKGRAGILAAYPVVILAGEVTLSEEWGKALAQYVERGGTLVVCAEQLLGRGVGGLTLPGTGDVKEAEEFEWEGKKVGANVFRYRPIDSGGARVLAKVGDDALVTASRRGEGQIVWVSVPLGLGIDQRPVPVLGLLMQRLVKGLLPVKVSGEVEWVLNKLDDSGWAVTLLNNRGVIKPQHGVLPTEHGERISVVVTTAVSVTKATEWIAGSDVQVKQDGARSQVTVEVPAGGVRIVELR
ncbi:MAG TPA: hypothetical protein VGQ99_06670 [Tepidisphaeraceae bacterium]|nr:hypothetical protein [Tepidisphaeraceae bacterium]